MVHRGAEAKSYSALELFERKKHHKLIKRIGYIAAVKSLSVSVIDPLGQRLGAEEFLGNGGEQIVYANKGQVIKLLWPTLGNNRNSLQAKIDSLNQNEQLCRSFIGPSWLDTDYDLANLWPYRAVVAHQDRVRELMSFKNMEDLADFTQDYPALRRDLAVMVAGVRRLHNHSGLYIDLLGPGNVVLAAGEEKPSLKILDTIPAGLEHQSRPSLEDPTMNKGEKIAEKLALLQQSGLNS